MRVRGGGCVGAVRKARAPDKKGGSEIVARPGGGHGRLRGDREREGGRCEEEERERTAGRGSQSALVFLTGR